MPRFKTPRPADRRKPGKPPTAGVWRPGCWVNRKNRARLGFPIGLPCLVLQYDGVPLALCPDCASRWQDSIDYVREELREEDP